MPPAREVPLPELVIPVTPNLPPVPPAHGPLTLRVAYPTPGDRVEAGDSSFIFGTTADGDAALTINGQRVLVWPNGAWLGWIRFPADSVMRFDLVARTATDSARLEYAARRAFRYRAPPSGLWVDTTSFGPSGRVWWPRNEILPLSVRAAPGATLTLILPGGQRIPLRATTEPNMVAAGLRAFDRDTNNLSGATRSDIYRGGASGAAIGTGLGPILGAPPDPPGPEGNAVLEVTRGNDTLRARWPLRVALLDTVPQIAELDDDLAGTGGTDHITVGRAALAGTYTWFFPKGTRAPVTGRINGNLRMRLGDATQVWVAASEATLLGSVDRGPAVVGSVTMTPLPDRTVVRIPAGYRVPFEVREEERRVTLVLYGSVGDVNWIRYGAGDHQSQVVETAAWRQEGAEVHLSFDLSEALWGFRTRWDRNDLVLEIRRPPAIDPRDPFDGRLIVVDPGHPPTGATGPSGLREAEANLAVGLRLAELLRQAGARVMLTRETDTPVDLAWRPAWADTVGAEILVSIHNNALPDGVNPFTNNGTSVFYNQPRSIPLARAVQRALVARLGTRDLGVGRGDLALVRPTWMPSILTEGLFMMMPDHEAALRTRAGQDLYARGVMEGLRAFLEERGRAQRAR